MPKYRYVSIWKKRDIYVTNCRVLEKLKQTANTNSSKFKKRKPDSWNHTEATTRKVYSISHWIWCQIYRIQNQIWFQFHFDLVSNLKLKRNVFFNAVSEIRIHRIYFRLVSFFCESVLKLKPESGLNLDKSHCYLSFRETKTNCQKTKNRFMKPHRNRETNRTAF